MGRTDILTDGYGRRIDYLRISITDRCNLRCTYCMPEGICLVPPEEILTFEEIETVCRAAAELGIRKFKITGGEPLVRKGCPELIGRLSRLPGAEQVTLTTNGILLGKYLDRLLNSGLKAVNVSLDTLKPDVYRQITGHDGLGTVLENIDRAVNAGLRVKINSVFQKGINDGEWAALCELSRERKVDVRFIEMMPIGSGRSVAAVRNDELLLLLREKYPYVEKEAEVHGNGPAVYYRVKGFAGSTGFISAVHGKFCGSCNRIRMTAQGELKPCLCYSDKVDVRTALRGGMGKSRLEEEPGGSRGRSAKSAVLEEGREENQEENKEKNKEEMKEKIKQAIQEAVRQKPGMHCFEQQDGISENRQMVQIGG